MGRREKIRLLFRMDFHFLGGFLLRFFFFLFVSLSFSPSLVSSLSSASDSSASFSIVLRNVSVPMAGFNVSFEYFVALTSSSSSSGLYSTDNHLRIVLPSSASFVKVWANCTLHYPHLREMTCPIYNLTAGQSTQSHFALYLGRKSAGEKLRVKSYFKSALLMPPGKILANHSPELEIMGCEECMEECETQRERETEGKGKGKGKVETLERNEDLLMDEL